MSAPSQPIPIFVMSYNDLTSLRLCLRALSRRTLRAHRIVVVDNASTDPELVRYLDELGREGQVEVVRNRWNLWVLGLNASVRAWARDQAGDSYFAVTDCDIVVPPPRDGQCWLTRLENVLDTQACVGKIGLALDLGYIQSRAKFDHTYQREQFFMQGPKIAEWVIAPVDTTMALYRKSLFVTNLPLFIPGHQSLYRPHYYCCRTPADFQARHLSWRFYAQRSAEDVVRKLLCFGILGATVVPAVYLNAPAYARLLHFVLKPLGRMFWGAVVIALVTRYLVRNFPRNYNPLLASRRA